MSNSFLIPFWCAVVLILYETPAAFGATAAVEVGNGTGGLVFVPAVTNITVNDTVTWNWNGSFHSTTSGQNLTPNGLWDSGVFSTPHSFSFTFTNAGNFPYFCSVHGSFGMTGSVSVEGGTVPPTVTITNPVTGAVFVAPAMVTIEATVNDTSGSVTNVAFFDGSSLLGNSTTSPYSISVNLAVGSHSLTAQVFDNLGATNVSTPVAVSVISNAIPAVAIVVPTNGASFTAPATVTITASASSSSGTVTNVAFFDGSSLLANATTSPYSISVNLPAGSHTLTAEVFDNLGATNTSTPVTVSIVSNSIPTVAIIAPTNSASFTAPATVTITASASSSSGTVTNVAFFDGSSLLGNATTSPYSISVNLAAGNHTLTAEVFDNLGATNTSTPVTVSVVSNSIPTVAIVVPTNGASFTAPATVSINASASSSNGTVTNVAFFDGSSLLGNAATNPYSISINLAVGSHTLTAEAFDNSGATNTSAPVTVTVVSSTTSNITFITAPTNGSFFTAPATILIAGSVTNASSAVTNVEFFDNASSLGSVTNAPFAIVSNLGVGAHELMAVAMDSLGVTNTSASVGVSVTASNLPVSQPKFTGIVLSNKFPSPPLTVTNMPIVTNGLVTFTWTADARSKFDLLYSSNLGDTNSWTLAQPNIVGDPSGTSVLSDPPYLASPAYSPNTNLLYRLRALPPQSPGLPIRLQMVASNLVSPTALTHAHDSSGRLFIADQIGQIRIVDNTGNLLTTPFLDVSNKLVTLMPGYDERGLLGLAFHPDYSTNGRFFIYYVAPPTDTNFDSRAVLSEFKVSAGDPNLADTNSERVLLTINEPESNHKGADLVFGLDGFLYLGPGDGGGEGDQHGTNGNGQILSTFLGKILRVDVDHGSPYAIPADNPFVNTPGALPEIYAYGLRNPRRFSFDRGGTNEGFIADVGQNLWEEIDIMRKGANYGWRILEGNHAFELSTATALNVDVKTLDYPIFEYGHGPSGIAVIGGYVYRGTNYTELVGQYVFGDFSTSLGEADGQLYYLSQTRPGIWERFSFQLWPDNARLGRFVKGFGEDEAGEIYLLSTTNLGPKGLTGDVRRLVRP